VEPKTKYRRAQCHLYGTPTPSETTITPGPHIDYPILHWAIELLFAPRAHLRSSAGARSGVSGAAGAEKRSAAPGRPQGGRPL